MNKQTYFLFIVNLTLGCLTSSLKGVTEDRFLDDIEKEPSYVTGSPIVTARVSRPEQNLITLFYKRIKERKAAYKKRKVSFASKLQVREF